MPRKNAKKPAKRGRGRGRPPKPAGEARSANLRLRLTPAEKVAIETAAAQAGLSVTEHVVRSAGG